LSNLNIFRACCGELNPTGFRILSGTVIHLFVILLISSYPLAQVSLGGTPYGIALGLSRSSVPTITMPTVNIDSLIAVGNAEDPTLPNRIGYSHSVNLSTVNSGFWEDLNDELLNNYDLSTLWGGCDFKNDVVVIDGYLLDGSHGYVAIGRR